MNFKAMNSHLTSEQMDGLLCGSAGQDVERHVAGCTRCATEVASLRGVFGGMRASAAVAGERHRRLAVASSMRRVPAVAWVFAAAAIFVSVGAPLLVHRMHAHDGPAGAGLPAVTMSDEALLSSVQDDLASSVPEPLLPLAGTSSTSTNRTSTQRKN